MYHDVTHVEPTSETSHEDHQDPRHGGAHPGDPRRTGPTDAPRSAEARTEPDGAGGPAARTARDERRDERKERVLHTRIPAVLERELKRFAEGLRVPVSNLVRAILEDALSVADAASENVEERLKNAARHIEKEREKLKRRIEVDPLAGVVAFQEVTLALDAACAKCGRELRRGTRALLGIG